MSLDHPTLWMILGGLVLAYGAIRFVLLPWLVPRLADEAGKGMRGGGYQDARARGASIGDALAQGKEAMDDHDDRALAQESGVPLEVLRAFRREHAGWRLRAEALPADDVGPRFRVRGDEPEVEGYSPGFAEAVYRRDGTRVAEADEDDDEPPVASVTWEGLPEHIRRAASTAVPGGEFADGCAPDEEEPYYEITLSTPAGGWLVEIDPSGQVRRTRKLEAKPGGSR
jgi:hypothetical protein